MEQLTFNEKLNNLAQIACDLGVNLQPGQKLLINTPVSCSDFARLIAEKAFERNAKDVMIQYHDEYFSKIRYQHADLEALTSIPKWQQEKMNDYVNQNFAIISIYAEDPDAMQDVDAAKIVAANKAMQKAGKRYQNAILNDQIRWCVISVPTSGWAHKVFPELPVEEAVQKLWDAVFYSTRTDVKDPIHAWQTHNNNFHQKVNFLNQHQFKELIYTSSSGTNLHVGMPENHIWSGGSEVAQDGISFFPNMPTEEIFCAPHKDRINGKLVSTHPLVYNGQLIDHFQFTFKDGIVTDFSAEQGYETLKALIESTSGSNQLGEVSFVPYDSPIQNLNLLFYNTLFDENASCHFALGAAYPSCIKNGQSMDDKELTAAGLNVSDTHVDFMVGSSDLDIVGVDSEGKTCQIFKDGNWAF
ncbi:aminopeptidase [Pseudoramibacter sp.]|jgi:aminopeptidase|uniref:aminopeptidase n=1 Tax=Pseudoramibacter sp. TaxID=2034862 RepID=UPI0025DC71C4|nr:aminopeptidase [Pseudoramibacter sp.]MCH4072782.1 aminopeptidase [Pseudoramibacter sp.]MCH4106553.1 aminopeptidase [Pseudoramibacter sp.]